MRRIRYNLLLSGAVATLSAIAALAAAGEPPKNDLTRAAAELKARYAADLDALAAWCEARGLHAQAKQTRAARGPSDPYKLYLPVLPDELRRPELPADAPAELREWDARFARLRHEQALALYEIARKAVRTRRASLAYELVLEAIRVNLDFEPARRVLGYQKYAGGWYTNYEVRKLRANQVWHPKFGWLPKTYVRRYEEGQRVYNNRWVTAEDDARAHQKNIEAGWDLETEHYTIRTDHSIEAGVELGTKLERLYRLWQQIFIRYYASEAHVVGLFEGRPRPAAEAPHLSVAYFRDREDYNRSLRAAVPNIGVSVGLYLDQMRRAYFFAGEEADDRTLYHEATHQLFHQSRPVAPNVGRKTNFWIVEGIAMYLESLHQEGDYYVLGGVDDLRFHAAQYRLLNDKFYVPLAEVSEYGMEKIQKDPRIATLYSQFAGLTYFLIYHDGGRYRDALVAYLSTVYSGRDDANTLAQLTGTSYADLDAQYRQFILAAAKAAVQRGP